MVTVQCAQDKCYPVSEHYHWRDKRQRQKGGKRPTSVPQCTKFLANKSTVATLEPTSMLQVKKTCSRTQASRLCTSPTPRSASVACQQVHSDVFTREFRLQPQASSTLMPPASFNSGTKPSKSFSRLLSTPTRHPRDQTPSSKPLQHKILGLNLLPAVHSDLSLSGSVSSQRPWPPSKNPF